MARKRRKTENEGGADIGMVMTVSLFLILLTFFILLNSIAVLDENRTRVALGSLIGAFGGLPGGLSPLETGESILPPTAPMVNEELTLEQLLTYMNRSTTLSANVKAGSVKHGETVTINEAVLFEADGLTIKKDMIPFLNKLCDLINAGDFPVEIVGHTDGESTLKKGYRSPWEQSTLMALQVLKYFISQGGVAPRRLTGYGHGIYRPVIEGTTWNARSKNRRVEIVLRYEAPQYVRRIFNRKSNSHFTYKKFDFKIF